MKRSLVVSLLSLFLLLLSGCAAVQPAASSTELFAICKTADVVTTSVAINSGKFHEANPLLKPLIGPHNFMPLIIFSVALYAFLDYLDNPIATTVANVATCGVAGNNLKLLVSP